MTCGFPNAFVASRMSGMEKNSDGDKLVALLLMFITTIEPCFWIHLSILLCPGPNMASLLARCNVACMCDSPLSSKEW